MLAGFHGLSSGTNLPVFNTSGIIAVVKGKLRTLGRKQAYAGMKRAAADTTILRNKRSPVVMSDGVGRALKAFSVNSVRTDELAFLSLTNVG